MASSYDPILADEALSAWRLFQARPSPEPGEALVFVAEGRQLVTLRHGDRLTVGELRWGRYRRAIRVNLGEYNFTFHCSLPCQGDAYEFKAHVEVTCSVSEPAVIVERKIRDLQQTLQPLLTQILKRASRLYPLDDSAAAEIAVYQAVTNHDYQVGIRLDRVVIGLSLDEEARQHLRTLQGITQQIAVKQAEIKASIQTGIAQQSLEAQQRQAAAMQSTWQREQERLQQEAEIAMQRMRMEFYGPLIEQGQWQLLSLHLSNHPHDVEGVVQMMRQQRQVELEYNLKALDTLLTKADLEEMDVAEPAREILGHISDVLRSEVNAPPLLAGFGNKATPLLGRTEEASGTEVDAVASTREQDTESDILDQ